VTTAYPAALDAYGDPAGAAVQGSTTPTHSGHHTNHNDAIEAIETKLGTGTGAPPASAAVLRRTGTGASGWGQIVAGDITNDTITATQIALNAITSSELADNAVDTAAIVANAVTQSAFAVGATPSPTTTTASYADLPDMAAALTTTGGDLIAVFVGAFLHTDATRAAVIALSLDGATEVSAFALNVPAAGKVFMAVTMRRFTGVSAASHTVKARWLTDAATLSANGTDRYLLLVELKK
jgi:hypothetical protein